MAISSLITVFVYGLYSQASWFLLILKNSLNMTKELKTLETDEIRADRTVEKIQCPSGKIVYVYNQEGNCFMIFGIKENIVSFEDLYNRV